jgi:hypothetical protein
VPSAAAIAAPPSLTATRYVAPLREGGSLPALVEADDDGLYVLKFRGAGQGPLALVAELVAGRIAGLLGLPVPEIALIEVDRQLGTAEPDPEIQDLLRASVGLNVGLDFLPGALSFDPAGSEPPSAERAADIVWFDALISNVDRTPRNPNLLEWHGRLWLIDHGAALYHHHRARGLAGGARAPFAQIGEHVLLPYAGSIAEADARLAPLLDRAALDRVAALIPDPWLEDGPDGGDPDAGRVAYADHLATRLEPPRGFAEEAERARRRVT